MCVCVCVCVCVCDWMSMQYTSLCLFHLEALQYRILINIVTVIHSRITKTLLLFIIINRFYIALFSALEQTHCARM